MAKFDSADNEGFSRWDYDDREPFLRPWRKISIADARRCTASWKKRVDAEEMLDNQIHEAQLLAASCALGRPAQAADLKAKPQKGPLYTQYPGYPAARACIGHTAIAETLAQLQAGALPPVDSATLGPRAARVDPTALARTAQYVQEQVGYRQVLDHLTHFRNLTAAESYRLFACAMNDFSFPLLRDVICAAVNLGECLAGWVSRPAVRAQLHPLTVRVFDALTPVVAEYTAALNHCEAHELPARGAALQRALLTALLPLLPPPAAPTDEKHPATAAPQDVNRVPLAREGRPLQISAADPLRGLDELGPPLIDQPANPLALLCARAGGEAVLPSGVDAGHSDLQMLLQALGQSLSAATQDDAWGTPRTDAVSRTIQTSLFRPGVMEDKLATEKHRVKLFGTNREELIAEEILPRARDAAIVDRVRRGAAPIERKLRRFQWFGNRKELAVDRHHSQGSLDARRLHRIGTSALLYRQWHEHVVTDYHGEPLVVLAMDGSSSNTVHTSFAGQIVTAAFLKIARLARIRVLAAEYSSGSGGALVRWLHHPRKTAGARGEDALEVIASLPLGGQGCNHDVGSISYIIRVALPLLAPGQVVYVVNITDGQYNSPLPEVRAMIRALREQIRLVYTVVVLGEHVVDLPEAHHVVHVPAAELQDAHAIAERIGIHVHGLVQNMRTKGKRGHVAQRLRRRAPVG